MKISEERFEEIRKLILSIEGKSICDRIYYLELTKNITYEEATTLMHNESDNTFYF